MRKETKTTIFIGLIIILGFFVIVYLADYLPKGCTCNGKSSGSFITDVENSNNKDDEQNNTSDTDNEGNNTGSNTGNGENNTGSNTGNGGNNTGSNTGNEGNNTGSNTGNEGNNIGSNTGNTGNNTGSNTENFNGGNGKCTILVDRSTSDYCAEVIDVFYTDSNYEYYYNCLKSPYMYVKKNGKEYKLVDALKNGIVTISELEANGCTFLKRSKNVVDR